MSIIQGRLKRSGFVAALLLLAMALAAPVASATPQSEATEWLSSQLKSPKAGEKYCELFGPNVGQTIDCMLAFDAETGFENQENETWAWILANKNSYVGSEPCSTASSMSAGAVAKLALGAEAHGVDPQNVGGRNLIADLQCLQVSKAGADQGWFKDKGATDFSNVFGQSLAIIALKACSLGKICTSPPSLTTTLNRAASYLRSQQCTEHKEEKVKGAFRSALGLEAGTCENKTPFPSETEFNVNAIDIDSTGFAIEALWNLGGASATAAKAAGEWMYGERIITTGPPKRLNWQNYCSFTEPKVKFDSVNSSALAIMGAAEIEKEVTPAREWLADAVASGENRGMPACGATGNGDVLATAQGILGLNGASYPKLVGL